MSDQNKSTLVSIVNRSNEIAELLIAAEGEITPEMELILSELSRELICKIDSCSIVLSRLEMERVEWKSRADRYQRIAKSFDAARERVRGMIKFAMTTSGVDILAGDEARFTISRSKSKVVINEAMLDQSYKMQHTEWVVDRDRVIADLNAGKDVPGAYLEEVVTMREYANKGKK